MVGIVSIVCLLFLAGQVAHAFNAREQYKRDILKLPDDVFMPSIVATNTSNDDLGGTWTKVDYLDGAPWFAVASTSTGKNITAIADGIYLSTNYGATWHRSGNAPNFTDNSYYQSVAMSADGQYIGLAVNGGPIILSNDYGMTWRNCTGVGMPGSASTHWNDIAMSASGQYIGAVILGGNTYISADFGLTWERGGFSEFNNPNIHSTITANFFAVAISHTGQHMVVVSGDGTANGEVYYSHDFGNFFDPSQFETYVEYLDQQWVGVAMDSTGQNVTVTNSRVRGGAFASTDGGKTFEQLLTVPNITSLCDVDMSADGTIITMSNLATSGANSIYMSLDAGLTWNKTTAPAGDWLDFAMSDDGSFMVGANYGVALYTYLPNCPAGMVHKGYTAEGGNPCEPCSAGTYTESFGASTCIECGEGTYSTATGANGESTCKDCPYPWDTMGSGDTKCPVLWLNMPTITLLFFLGALLSILVVIFLFGNNNQVVALIIMVFPALDVLTDLTYILISRFYNVTVFVFCVLFFMHPAPMFLYKLYKYRALPYTLRYIWWLGASSTFTENAAGNSVARDSEVPTAQQGDHIPFPTMLGRRFTLLISFDSHDNLYVVVLEVITWIVAIFAQAATLVLLPAFLVLWLFIGIFLQMTKTIAMGTVWNTWFYVWTGHTYWNDEYGAIDTEDLNYGLLSQFCLETIPHIILQSVNNTLLGTWVSDPIAIFSLVMSIFMAVATIYKYLYHIGLRADPQGMKDIPLDKSVTLKVMFTKIEYTILNARLEPHSRNITIPTQEQLRYREQKYSMLVEEEGGSASSVGGTGSAGVIPSAPPAVRGGLTSSLIDPVQADDTSVYATAVFAPPAMVATAAPSSAPPAEPSRVNKTAPESPTPAMVAPAAMRTSSPSPAPTAAPCPPELLCPMTKRIMSDPVFCSDGFTYERAAIEQHFTSQQELLAQVGLANTAKVMSPMTKQPLETTQLFPNRAVLAAISAYYASIE